MFKLKYLLLSAFLMLNFSHTVYGKFPIQIDFQKSEDWSYSGITGPAYWGRLHQKYHLCEEGCQQSPINIGLFTFPDKNILYYNYREVPLDLVLNSKNLYINMRHSRNEFVIFQGQHYFLQHLHFHSPSEHTILNKRYPMEAHFVHKNEQGQLLVIGVFIKKGKSNPILNQLFNLSFPLVGHEEIFKTVYINPAHLIPRRTYYYSYLGSLTTPPCSENVIWIVMRKPIEASEEEIQLFKEKVNSFNSRPLQPLNRRGVWHTVNRH